MSFTTTASSTALIVRQRTDVALGETLRELAELMEGRDQSVSIVVEVTSQMLVERLRHAEDRLRFYETLHQWQDEIRHSDQPSRAKHLALELTCRAKERGDFAAVYQIADVVATTGLSESTIRRAEKDLYGVRAAKLQNSGQGAKNRKVVELIPKQTLTEISHRLEAEKPPP
jgi:hypothetical protein